MTVESVSIHVGGQARAEAASASHARPVGRSKQLSSRSILSLATRLELRAMLRETALSNSRVAVWVWAVWGAQARGSATDGAGADLVFASLLCLGSARQGTLPAIAATLCIAGDSHSSDSGVLLRDSLVKVYHLWSLRPFLETGKKQIAQLRRRSRHLLRLRQRKLCLT